MTRAFNPDAVRQPPRTYYAKRLLEHGPLTFREFYQITGWPKAIASHALEQLVDTGVAVKYSETGTRCFIFGLAE